MIIIEQEDFVYQYFEIIQKHFPFVTGKNVCQTHVCVTEKRASILLEKRNFEC